MSENYDLKSTAAKTVPAPELPYRPPAPQSLRPKIGLIGCGGVSQYHLGAYQRSGWEVVALYDPRREAAEARQKEFCPEATLCRSATELLELQGLTVVDIATHPDVRGPLIEKAIEAGVPILSQKPFSLDLCSGRLLAEKADAAGVPLAVNQNGRWAPYFAYMRKAVQAGLIGEVSSVSISLNWDHTWTAGTAFEEVHHLILYDFGIHWFDAACSFFGDRRPTRAFASISVTAQQTLKPPLIASAIVDFPHGIATLQLNGASQFGPQESCVIVGSQGTLRSIGAVCGPQTVTLETGKGQAHPELEGTWFVEGFQGTMGELLCAIEEQRAPENSAASALDSLSACYAALQSADEGRAVVI